MTAAMTSGMHQGVNLRIRMDRKWTLIPSVPALSARVPVPDSGQPQIPTTHDRIRWRNSLSSLTPGGVLDCGRRVKSESV